MGIQYSKAFAFAYDLLGCPSILGIPINLRNFETHHQLRCKQIPDSQAFQSSQQSNIIHSDITICCIVEIATHCDYFV